MMPMTSAWEQKCELARLTNSYSVFTFKILTPTPDFPNTTGMISVQQGKSWLRFRPTVEELTGLIDSLATFKANLGLLKTQFAEVEKNMQAAKASQPFYPDEQVPDNWYSGSQIPNTEADPVEQMVKTAERLKGLISL